MKNKVIISSILTIAMCLSMIAGSTFALFTSEDSVNVAVTSGKVSVTAVAENLTLGSTLGANLAETSANFIEDTNEIQLVNFVPGDFAKFDLRIKNESTVTVNYRTIIQKVADTGLFGGLNVTIGNETYGGNLKYSPWSTILPGSADVIVPVVISLPESAGVAYMAKSCTISYMVEAVQGNASLVEAPTNADQLQAAINAGVNEIVLMNDITDAASVVIPAGKTVSLDLNGNTITGGLQANSTEKHVYAIENRGHLTIKNGTIEARGVANYGSLVVESGTFKAIDNNGGAPIWNYSGSEVIINGGEFFTSDDPTAPGPTGLNVAAGSKATVNGGKFYVDANQTYGIINNGELVINDIEIYADHGVISSSGTLTINDGKFVQRGNLVQTSSLLHITSGTTTVNGGVFNFNVAGQLDSGLPVYCAGGSVAISGGTFTGYVTEMISSWGGTGSASVTGGTFDKCPAYVAAGYTAIQNNGKWTVLPEGTTSVANDCFVSVSGDTYYATSTNGFNSAISNATAGQTVEVLSDVSVGGTQLALDKEITVDLNGNELTTSNNYGGMSIKNGASIKNGTINHTGNTAAIKVGGDAGTIENVVINMVPTEGKTKTGIQVYNGKYVESIKNVTITGATQGIEVAKGSRVDLIENVTVEADTVALLVNGASVGKVVNCSLTGGKHGVHMMLNGEVHVSLELVGCTVKGGEAAIISHDEAGISNVTNCSLTLTYDSTTKLDGEFVWNFEDECKSVVTLNAPAN